MPSDVTVVGWEDYDGNRHEGLPNNLSEVYGQLIYVPGDEVIGRGDEHFWAFVRKPLGSWDDWYDYIEGLVEMYGSSLE